MVACCAVHLLIVVGVFGGLGGWMIGGITVAAGVVIAAVAWGIARRLQRSRTCHVPKGWVRPPESTTRG